MSGEFVTLAEATAIMGAAPAGNNTFVIDMANLMTYITDADADQLHLTKGIYNGSETLVITCYKNGNAVYHLDANNNQCVLEHLMPPIL